MGLTRDQRSLWGRIHGTFMLLVLLTAMRQSEKKVHDKVVAQALEEVKLSDTTERQPYSQQGNYGSKEASKDKSAVAPEHFETPDLSNSRNAPANKKVRNSKKVPTIELMIYDAEHAQIEASKRTVERESTSRQHDLENEELENTKNKDEDEPILDANQLEKEEKAIVTDNIKVIAAKDTVGTAIFATLNKDTLNRLHKFRLFKEFLYEHSGRDCERITASTTSYYVVQYHKPQQKDKALKRFAEEEFVVGGQTVKCAFK
ncbi:hypothetical protein FQN54_007275 [Arachnomyces sp. PD_36]|nr:hypothetical protein FQN54_007275 [Arachnomyces sp. PD_36]